MPQKGHFVLHSNVIPTLTAGEYELVSAQSGLPFTVSAAHNHVHVAAPRYVMPPEQILSSFPPANAEGAFGDRLPQIVLKRRTLPWERNPAGQTQPSATPWLALVVFAEGEAELSTATPVAQCVTAGTALLDPNDKDVEQGLYLAATQTVVAKIFPCQEDLPLLTHVREVDINDTELANGDDDGWLAVVLANRLPVFDAASGKSVRYMACLVNVEGQLSVLPKPEAPIDHFTFERVQDWSVLAGLVHGPDPRVMGGVDLGSIQRPLVAGARQLAPVRAAATPTPLAALRGAGPRVGVALDGANAMPQTPVSKQWLSATDQVAASARDPDAKRLIRDTMASGFRYPIELFAQEKVYRFPVLAHWSFTTNEGATFESLMQNLDVGLLGTVPVPEPASPPRPGAAPEIVETGHISLVQRSRRGEALRAWYRGPLVPFPTLREQPVGGVLPVAHSADQLRAVVPDGREDLSLASAFEIGRLLGVSQLSVVSALLRFRSEQFSIGRVRELLAALANLDIPKIIDQRIDLGRFVALQTLGGLVKNPAQSIGPRRPIADPGRLLPVQGDLDQLIATGLGLDLGAIRRRADQIGTLAALGETVVPIAHPSGDLPIDGPALQNLRNSLSAELARVIDVAAAAPLAGTPSRAGRVASAQPRAKDALDALLEHAFADLEPDTKDS